MQTSCKHGHIDKNTFALPVFLYIPMSSLLLWCIHFRPKRMQVFIIFYRIEGKLSIKIQRILLVLSGDKQTWRVCRLPQINKRRREVLVPVSLLWWWFKAFLTKEDEDWVIQKWTLSFIHRHFNIKTPWPNPLVPKLPRPNPNQVPNSKTRLNPKGP